MECIPYVIVKMPGGKISRLSCSEKIAEMRRRADELGVNIRREFPQVRITGATIFGPTLEIPEDEAEKIAAKIGQLFDCKIARSDKICISRRRRIKK